MDGKASDRRRSSPRGRLRRRGGRADPEALEAGAGLVHRRAQDGRRARRARHALPTAERRRRRGGHGGHPGDREEDAPLPARAARLRGPGHPGGGGAARRRLPGRLRGGGRCHGGGGDPGRGDLGPRPHRPAQPAPRRQLRLRADRRERPRLRHRHGPPIDPRAVHRPGRQRLHGHQRRPGHERLQRPRHARGGDGRRDDPRRRQGGHPPPGARARLQRVGLDLGRHRRRRLGDREPGEARGRQHEPRRRGLERPRHRGRQLHQRGGHLRDRRRQLERRCLRDLAGPRGRRADGGRHHQHRRARVLLELRDLPRPLRPRLEHHLGLVHERHRDLHPQRHLDGVASRGRGGGPLPADEPPRHAGAGGAGGARAGDAGQGDGRGNGVAEPPPLLPLPGRRAARRHGARPSPSPPRRPAPR